jgi:SAM-dependent methyltransferase
VTGSGSRHRLAASLTGAGLEIGACHRPVPVAAGVRVRHVDVFPAEVNRLLNPDVPADEPLVEPDILCSGEDLSAVPSGSEDFVIASHVLEHIADPLGALAEWHRVIRPGGFLYLCLPDMRGTFDATRARTTLAHLVLDREQRPGHPERDARDREHFLEWARVVNRLADPRQAAFWADALRRGRYPIHFHCWVPEDLLEIAEWTCGPGRRPFRVRETEAAADQSEFALLLERA